MRSFALVSIAGRPRKRYYLKVASIVGKRINGRTYYYLATSARVSGRPRVVAQKYLGTAEDIAAAVESSTGASVRTSHLSFGDVAAAWHMLGELHLAELVDGVIGRQRATVSAGQLLAIAVLHRIVAPASTDIAQWWATTSAARFVRPRISGDMLGARRIRRALARVAQSRQDVEAAMSVRIRELLNVADEQALVVDLPDFATYVEHDDNTATARLAGLALVVSLDGTVPLITRPYRHTDREDTTFPSLADELIRRYRRLCGGDAVTVITGAGQETPTGQHFLALLQPGDHPNLVAAAPTGYRPVEPNRLPGVTALERRARLAGTDRRVVCVHSENLQAAHDRALARDLTHVTRRLDELATTLRSGRRSRDETATEVARITRFRWGDRVLSTRLTDGPDLHWQLDERAVARLRSQVFGKQLIVTDHDDWPTAQVITAYRTRYHLESTARYLGGGDVPEADLAAHSLVTVLATTVMHLMRHRAQQAGLDLSVRELFDALRGIQETELRSPSTGGRPRSRRILTEPDEVGRELFGLFDLSRYASSATS